MKKIDVYLANLMTGNVMLHNLHWNVTGLNFKQAHEYLEERYDEVFEFMDAVAEAQKMLGEYPVASYKKAAEISTVKDLESKDINSRAAMEEALNYYKMLRDGALAVREEYDGKCLGIVNMMEDHIGAYNKAIWFMDSMLK